MTVWQKRARFAVAVFGVVCAAVVYFATGRRPPPADVAPVTRIDPAASLESTGGSGRRFRGDKRDFDMRWDTQLTYPDGSTRLLKFVVRVNKDDGRSYLVTAGEAFSTRDQKQMQLSSGVHLEANDGFEMTAERATYTAEQGTIHSDVPVSFAKGRMSGSGTAVDYDEASEVLTVGQDARVSVRGDSGNVSLDFSAGSAVLDRTRHLLQLEGSVHMLRDAETMDADRGTAHLSPQDEFITFIELRGHSRVEGSGGTLDSMRARDIDLDYTDDGSGLERVVLTGEAGVALTGEDDAPGRQFTGEALDLQFGPDGRLTSAAGRERVRMLVPTAGSAPARSVQGNRFTGTGAPGQGLTDAHFSEAVEYREDSPGDAAGRIVHADRLDLTLAGAAIAHATFTGNVTFDESSFRAQAATAQYDPAAGTLHLTGSDRRGLPCVADAQIAVDAQTIDVTVQSRRLSGVGMVKSAIRPAGATAAVRSSPCAIARKSTTEERPAATADATRLPGLLKQDQVAVATADALDYGGTGLALVYRGHATLVQGETSLRGDVIRIDQQRGDLIVSGNARSLLVDGAGQDRQLVDGRAEQIRYVDTRRMISYLNAPGDASSGTGTVQVSSPERNLIARNVDVFLGESGSADRLEAYHDVTATIGTRKATADRLTYLAAEERYDMKGAGTVPVRLVDGCGELSGKTLTFYRSDNRISIDGREEMRTQVKSGACQQQPATSSR